MLPQDVALDLPHPLAFIALFRSMALDASNSLRKVCFHSKFLD